MTLQAPGERLLDRGHGRHVGSGGPIDDDHGQAALAGGIELCPRQRPAAVLGDDEIDPLAIDERALSGKRVGTTVEEQLVAWRKGAVGRIDTADQQPSLLDGGERGQALASGRKQDPRPELLDKAGSGAEIADALPAVTDALSPARPFQPERGDPGLTASLSGRGRNPFGERMAGIDDRIDVMVLQPLRESLGTAEAANPDLARRQSRVAHASGEGRDERNVALIENGRQRPRLRCPPENENHGQNQGSTL